MLCQHCQQAPRSRPRGLCWNCYYDAGVRNLYPITSKYARRGVLDFNGGVHLPSIPTQALPGSPEKIAVLQERAQLRQQLFHPDDATLETALLVVEDVG